MSKRDGDTYGARCRTTHPSSSFFDTGIVHVPHDRWIRTYTEESIRDLLKDFDITFIERTHYTLSGPFEWAMGDVTIQRTDCL